MKKSKQKAIFSRESNTLNKPTNGITVNTTSEYIVSIVRLGQFVTATFSDGTNNYSQQFGDLALTAIDGEYMYLCLFANRGLVVEFSNVQIQLTGEAQGA